MKKQKVTRPPRAYLYARLSVNDSIITCPVCRHEFQNTVRGKDVSCKSCGHGFTVPAPSSIETQFSSMHNYVQLYHDSFAGMEVVELWDIVSGTKPLAQRPSGKILLKELCPGDSVVFLELTRIWRNVRDTVNCLDYFCRKKITIHSVHERLDTSTAIGNCMLRVMASFAEMYAAQVSEKRKEVVRTAIRAGRAYPCEAPYGLRKVREADGHQYFQVNVDEAICLAYLKELTKYFNTRHAVEICNAAGCKSRSGKPWHMFNASDHVARAKLLDIQGLLPPVTLSIPPHIGVRRDWQKWWDAHRIHGRSTRTHKQSAGHGALIPPERLEAVRNELYRNLKGRNLCVSVAANALTKPFDQCRDVTPSPLPLENSLSRTETECTLAGTDHS